MQRFCALPAISTLSALVFFFACGSRVELQHASCRGCNVLLVTIDTLRADRVGAFGGLQGLTPALDKMAAEGLRLTRAYAAAPITLPSHATILTALSPPAHGLRANGLFRLGPTLPTLATILKGAGYRTGAFVGAFVLDARFGLNRGFDVYDDQYGEKHAGDPSETAERRAEDVIRPALAWITASALSPQPWFAWLHLYDPHEPYRAPEPYASQHAPYDAEVAYTDANVERVIAALEAARQLDRTLIVVAADHGESLGEHNERTHGVFAYDATLHVPWVMWARARIAPGAWDGLARLVDLAPTALDLVGVAAPAGFEGRSLVDRINANDRTGPPAYFEAMDANLTRNWAPLTGIISGTEKLIDLPVPELYELSTDPGETANLFATKPGRARPLEALLRSTSQSIVSHAAEPERTVLNAESRQRLAALGYIATSADPKARRYTRADDPKTLIAASNDLDRASGEFRNGAVESAMATVRGVIQTYPFFSTAYGIYASMQRDMGDLRGAIGTLEEAIRRGVENQTMMVVLADYLQEAGAAERSVELLKAVIATHPDYADAWNSLGVAYSRLGRHSEAAAAYEKVLALDPTSAATHLNLGVDAAGAGRLDAAVAHITRALELDPKLASAHNALAAALVRMGGTVRREEALTHWRQALDLNPGMFDALYNLGTVLYSSGRRDEAKPYLERFVAEAPKARYQPDIARIEQILRAAK